MWRALVSAVFPTPCPGCGRPADPVCDGCARTLRPPPFAPPPAPLDGWVAALAYEGVARELVARVKYRQARAALAWLAAAVADAVVRSHPPAAFDAVTWAPTTPARRRARGFDHGLLLARRVAGALGVPLAASLARRPGPPQTALPSAARRAGPSFVVRRPPVPPRLLLVDDVATTGGTLAAAARVLRDGGARRVVAATAARTGPPSGSRAFCAPSAT
jgi:predicted amidophosphoribosyltransferase